MKLLLLLLFCHFSFSEKHTLSSLFTVSSEVQSLPEVMTVLQVDGVHVLYWDSDIKKVELRQDFTKTLIKGDLQDLEGFSQEERILRDQLTEVMQHLKQTEGLHVLQRRSGCEWDDETAVVNPFRQYGYDGEDFIRLDMKTGKWVALKSEADTIKQNWDKGEENIRLWTNEDTNDCPQLLKMYLDHGNSSLHRPEFCTVFLLQKSPLAPVTCHVTGFHPDRAVTFWRKDGGDVREEMEPGEILPNGDGTYQMSVDLDISSIAPENWKRYECVCQLRGVNETTVKLDKTLIKTNWNVLSEFPIGPVIGCVVGFLLLAVIVAGLIRWRMNRKAVYFM